MAKFTPTKENTKKETALHKVCVDIYIKLLSSIELLGWKKLHIAADGFGVYSRVYEGDEYILNIDLQEVLVRGESHTCRLLEWEIKALPEWNALQEPVEKWRDYVDQYWDY